MRPQGDVLEAQPGVCDALVYLFCIKAWDANAHSVDCDSVALSPTRESRRLFLLKNTSLEAGPASSRAARFAARHNVNDSFSSISKRAQPYSLIRFDCCIWHQKTIFSACYRAVQILNTLVLTSIRRSLLFAQTLRRCHL